MERKYFYSYFKHEPDPGREPKELIKVNCYIPSEPYSGGIVFISTENRKMNSEYRNGTGTSKYKKNWINNVEQNIL